MVVPCRLVTRVFTVHFAQNQSFVRSITVDGSQCDVVAVVVVAVVIVVVKVMISDGCARHVFLWHDVDVVGDGAV